MRLPLPCDLTLAAACAVLFAGPKPDHAAPAPAPKPGPKSAEGCQAIPRWAMGRVIDRVRVKSGDKCIALTFDDGPSPGATREILKLLKEYEAKATFFLVGSQLHGQMALGREIRDAGHAIGNHSWNHDANPSDPAGEVRRTDGLLQTGLGVTPTLFRPPYGIQSNGYVRKALSEGRAVLIWSTDTLDWRRPGAERIASRVVRGAAPGKIVLMHDGGGDRRQTVAALRTILRKLKEKGYRFVTVPELLRMREEKMAAKVATKVARSGR